MKKVKILILLFFIGFSLFSCKEETKYTVTFVVNGSIVEKEEIGENKTISEPQSPTKEGYEFVGWFNGSEEWDFSDGITENVMLVARFELIKQKVELMAYYDSVEDNVDETLKTELHKLLKSTHKRKSYSYVWTALQKIDEYDADNIRCLYTGLPISKSARVGSSSANVQWNREHSWPKSHGFKTDDYAAYTDLHHLFASESGINATRGNKDWGNVENGNSDSYGNKWNSNYFEIRDEMKGDIARVMFYMVVRYDDASELDLELVNGTSSSSSNKTGRLGSLSVLLEWNELDPVSEEEKLRNENVFAVQGNRNPFVDYPEWVDLIF